MLALLLTPAVAQTEADAPPMARAVLKGTDGADHGTVTLTQTASGVLLKGGLTGLPPGAHGLHLHESGVCDPPFETAGDHFNPARAEHGFLVESGPHAGDMPNIHVPQSGALTIEILNAMVSLDDNALETLFDEDGSALLVHADPDNYEGQPSGNAGDRIACAVIER
jgi:Cu-Zn family superoxide dismutase